MRGPRRGAAASVASEATTFTIIGRCEGAAVARLRARLGRAEEAAAAERRRLLAQLDRQKKEATLLGRGIVDETQE